jgi:hypothetical protein
LIASVGRDGAALIALILLGGAVLLATSERGSRMRSQVADVARQAGPPPHGIHGEDDRDRRTRWGLRRQQLSEPDALALAVVARRLAIGQSIMTTTEVAQELRAHDFGFVDEHGHQVGTRAWLVSTDCFHELHRGRWALGLPGRPARARVRQSAALSVAWGRHGRYY